MYTASDEYGALNGTYSLGTITLEPGGHSFNAMKCSAVHSKDLKLKIFTPSLQRCHLKTTNKRAKFEALKPFCLLLHKRIALKTHSI